MKACEKTVVVLDHGPWFAGNSSEMMTMDKPKQGDDVSITKSLWTSCVEASFEYLRVMSDLFGESHLMRFVVSDFVGRFLAGQQSAWSAKLQSLEGVLEQLAQIGAPDPESDPDMCNIVNGILLAVESLSQVTDSQKQARRKGVPVRNAGRILVFTHIKQDEEIGMIEAELLDQIKGRNNLVQTLDESFAALDQVEFCLINVVPSDKDPDKSLLGRPKKQISSVLASEFHSSKSGQTLCAKIQSLAINHFDLISTTVTGIPMKEETTSAGGSVNYDVELFHAAEGHTELKRIGLLDPLLGPKKDGRTSLHLKWCSPNMKSGLNPDQFMCANATRVTPTAVNSRPSACLTSFILSGRTVLLEVPKKPGVANVQNSSLGGKPISHLLSAHGGQIFLHALTIGASPLEDPPSISEGPGGRVTDYRINWFSQFMRECCLTPGGSNEDEKPPNKMARTHILHISKHWPLTISSSFLSGVCSQPATTIYNSLTPMMTVMKKRSLSNEELMLCKTSIYSLLTMDGNNDPLPLPPSSCARLKGLKREEYYRPLWEELELYLRNYFHLSANHLSVLNCLLQCQSKPTEMEAPHEDIAQLDSLFASTSEKMDVTVSGNEEADPRVPEQPPSSKKIRYGREMKKTGDTLNFLSLFIRKYEEETWSHWKDFDGRVGGFKLYTNPVQDEEGIIHD